MLHSWFVLFMMKKSKIDGLLSKGEYQKIIDIAWDNKTLHEKLYIARAGYLASGKLGDDNKKSYFLAQAILNHPENNFSKNNFEKVKQCNKNLERLIEYLIKSRKEREDIPSYVKYDLIKFLLNKDDADGKAIKLNSLPLTPSQKKEFEKKLLKLNVLQINRLFEILNDSYIESLSFIQSKVLEKFCNVLSLSSKTNEAVQLLKAKALNDNKLYLMKLGVTLSKSIKKREDVQFFYQKALQDFPENRFGYCEYAVFCIEEKKYDDAIKLYELLLGKFTPTAKDFINLYKAHNGAGDYSKARKVLHKANAVYPKNTTVLNALSDSYKNDARYKTSEIYLDCSSLIKEYFPKIKKLSLLTDIDEIELGRGLLSEILGWERKSLLQYFHVINRVSSKYHDKRGEIVKRRCEIFSYVSNFSDNNAVSINEIFELALKFRLLSVCADLYQKNKKSISDKNIKHFEHVWSSSESLRALISVANKNETSNEMYGINEKGEEVCVERNVNPKTVEFFIPTFFFSCPSKDKETFKTLREIYISSYERLMAEGFVVIPRQQYNWRHYDPITSGVTISYHTHSDRDNSLHIQESVISGNCTLDNNGFAGFSTLADKNIKKLNLDDYSEETFDTLYNKIVLGNQSKYEQEDTLNNNTVPKKYVFVALQVKTDIVAKLSNIDSKSFLLAVIEKYKNTDIDVVIKRHPYCNSVEMADLLHMLKNEGNVHICNYSIHDLIRNALAVYTVNSGVGFEALLHLKPVIICGKSDYSPVVKTVYSVRELKLLDVPEVDPVIVKKYIDFYCSNYSHTSSVLPQKVFEKCKELVK